jgi:hypothetical protein
LMTGISDRPGREHNRIFNRSPTHTEVMETPL